MLCERRTRQRTIRRRTRRTPAHGVGQHLYGYPTPCVSPNDRLVCHMLLSIWYGPFSSSVKNGLPPTFMSMSKSSME